jgi:xylulokinase
MHGFVLVDAEGQPLSNFISWQDKRSTQTNPSNRRTYHEDAREALGSQTIIELGNEFRPGIAADTLYAIKQQGRMPSNCIVVSLVDYVAAALTVGNLFTEATNAAASGLLAVDTRRWHSGALEALELDQISMPDIQSAHEPVGKFSYKQLKIPVYTPIGDQQAALLGIGLQPGELSLNVATGSQVSMLADDPESGLWQVRPYFHGLWLRTVTHLPAGRALNCLIKLFSELSADQGTPLLDAWGQVAKLSASAKPSTIKANLNFFPTPYGSEGSLSQLREEEMTVGDIFRAAFQCMAWNYQRAAQRIAPEGYKCLVFSGGLVQKLEPLRQEIVSCLSPCYRVPLEQEDTLMGLLTIAEGIAA